MAKGYGWLNLNGEAMKGELHWYQEENVGIADMKLKPQKGGNWFVYES